MNDVTPATTADSAPTATLIQPAVRAHRWAGSRFPALDGKTVDGSPRPSVPPSASVGAPGGAASEDAAARAIVDRAATQAPADALSFAAPATAALADATREGNAPRVGTELSGIALQGAAQADAERHNKSDVAVRQARLRTM